MVDDPDLTLNEKRAILASWASDACAIEAAPELRVGPKAPVRFDDIMDACARSISRRTAAATATRSGRRFKRSLSRDGRPRQAPSIGAAMRGERFIIARERNVVRVDFRQEPEPPAPKFPGAAALRLSSAEHSYPEPAMRRYHDKELLTLLMAGALVAPPATPAFGNDNTDTLLSQRLMKSRTTNWLRAPELDKVPWLNFGSGSSVKKSDLMAGPKVDALQPFLLQPATPTTQFSSTWRFEPLSATE